MDGFKRITMVTPLTEDDNYVVIGVGKEGDGERVAFSGTYDDCEHYAQRNESPDNYERYYVAQWVEA